MVGITPGTAKFLGSNLTVIVRVQKNFGLIFVYLCLAGFITTSVNPLSPL